MNIRNSTVLRTSWLSLTMAALMVTNSGCGMLGGGSDGSAGADAGGAALGDSIGSVVDQGAAAAGGSLGSGIDAAGLALSAAGQQLLGAPQLGDTSPTTAGGQVPSPDGVYVPPPAAPIGLSVPIVPQLVSPLSSTSGGSTSVVDVDAASRGRDRNGPPLGPFGS